MTIAVTAATGQLGTLVVDHLLSRTSPDQVVAIARDAVKAEALAAKGVVVRIAGYDDPAALRAALVGVDRVLLISGNEFGRRIEQHRNVIDAAIDEGVQLLAYTSAPRVDTSTLPVAPDHLATEQHLATAGLPHTILRNGWYHENYLATVDAARRTGSVLTSAGDGRVSSAARADFAEAAAVVLTSDAPVKPVYELGGDVAWTQADLASTVSEIIGAPVTLTDVAPEQQGTILAEAGVPQTWVDFTVATDASIRNGELEVTSGDLSTLLDRPTTPLVETLRSAA